MKITSGFTEALERAQAEWLEAVAEQGGISVGAEATQDRLHAAARDMLGSLGVDLSSQGEIAAALAATLAIAEISDHIDVKDEDGEHDEPTALMVAFGLVNRYLISALRALRGEPR